MTRVPPRPGASTQDTTRTPGSLPPLATLPPEERDAVRQILRESPSAPDFTDAERRGAASILDDLAHGWPESAARSAVHQVARDLRDPSRSLPRIVADAWDKYRAGGQ